MTHPGHHAALTPAKPAVIICLIASARSTSFLDVRFARPTGKPPTITIAETRSGRRAARATATAPRHMAWLVTTPLCMDTSTAMVACPPLVLNDCSRAILSQALSNWPR